MIEFNRTRIINGLAFHHYTPGKLDWKNLIEFFEQLLQGRYDTLPNLMGIDGASIDSGRTIKTYKNLRKKLEVASLEEITTLEMYLSSDGTKDTEEFLIAIGATCQKSANLSACSFCIDSGLEPYSKSLFIDVAKNIKHLTGATYGYFYESHIDNMPVLYDFGCGRLLKPEPDEKQKNSNWQYHTYEYKTGDMRDIYRLNFLQQEHLDREVLGQRLEDWIKSSSQHGELTKEGENFWVWHVPDEQASYVRNKLKDTGLLLAFVPRP